MNQSDNLNPEQADVVMDMMISEQKRAMFEADRKKRIKHIQTLPMKWAICIIALGLIVIGIGIYYEQRIILIFLSVIILQSLAQLIWRYRARHSVYRIRNERFEDQQLN